MSTIQRLYIPPPWKFWEKRIQFKKLVTSKSWDSATRFGAVDYVRETWRSYGLSDHADDPVSIVKMLTTVFEEDRDMHTYVVDERNQHITSPEEWKQVVETYAYVVLQRYNREMEAR